jgi:hypothetical protein
VTRYDDDEAVEMNEGILSEGGRGYCCLLIQVGFG